MVKNNNLESVLGFRDCGLVRPQGSVFRGPKYQSGVWGISNQKSFRPLSHPVSRVNRKSQNTNNGVITILIGFAVWEHEGNMW